MAGECQSLAGGIFQLPAGTTAAAHRLTASPTTPTLPQMRIRRATTADLAATARLGALLLRVHYEFDQKRFMQPGPGAEEGYSWFLRSQLDNPDALMLV